MESEKVKEIKEYLEEEVFIATNFEDKLRRIPTRDLQKILTLINELESENESLQKGVKRLKKRHEETIKKNADECVKKFCETTMYYEQEKLVNENQQLKDRIAELENQMCRNEDLHTATEKLNDTIILRQFAERLKEKVKNFCGTGYENGYYIVTKSFACNEIDETLKEYEQ